MQTCEKWLRDVQVIYRDVLLVQHSGLVAVFYTAHTGVHFDHGLYFPLAVLARMIHILCNCNVMYYTTASTKIRQWDASICSQCSNSTFASNSEASNSDKLKIEGNAFEVRAWTAPSTSTWTQKLLNNTMETVSWYMLWHKSRQIVWVPSPSSCKTKRSYQQDLTTLKAAPDSGHSWKYTKIVLKHTRKK